MTPIAITMMIIAILTVWGGLALALVNLKRHPEDEGALPEVNVEGGELPEVDVDAADVDITTDTQTIVTPDIDVNPADTTGI